MEFIVGKLPEQMAEVLEAIWTLEEKGQDKLDDILRESAVQVTDELLTTLQEQDLITMDGERRVRLAKAGPRRADYPPSPPRRAPDLRRPGHTRGRQRGRGLRIRASAGRGDRRLDLHLAGPSSLLSARQANS